jgi:hypothetical protein
MKQTAVDYLFQRSSCMRRANLKTKIMNEAEKLLEKFARKNMIEWNQESFKKSHSRLHKSIALPITFSGFVSVGDLEAEIFNNK